MFFHHCIIRSFIHSFPNPLGTFDISIYQVLEDRERGPRLLTILKGLKKGQRCLVFALYKKEAARLESKLKYQGFNCCSIHGDKSQREREDALSQFRKNITPLMVATDVAARGLDIPGERDGSSLLLH